MSWQDVVLAVGSVALTVTPLGMFSKPPTLLVSVPTCLVLTAFTAVYASLGLELTMSTTFLSALTWMSLAIERKVNGK